MKGAISLKLLKLLDKHFEEFIVVILFSWVILLIFAQVVFRYFIPSVNIPWTEELARYSYIFMVFIGVSMCTRTDGHLKVDILKGVLSPKWQRIHRIFLEICVAAFFIFLIPSAFKIVHAQQLSAKLLPISRIPMYLFSYSMVAMTFLVPLRSFQAIVLEFLELRKMKKGGDNTEMKEEDIA